MVRLGDAWTTFRGKRLKVVRVQMAGGDGPGPLPPGQVDASSLRVGTGDGALALVSVQPEGKGPQDAAAWRNGARLQPGERLGT